MQEIGVDREIASDPLGRIIAKTTTITPHNTLVVISLLHFLQSISVGTGGGESSAQLMTYLQQFIYSYRYRAASPASLVSDN